MDIKIAVCDDEVEICASLEMVLIDIFRDNGMSCEVESFYTGESLCREFERRRYDLIFLDIEMDGKSGIDVGSFLIIKRKRIILRYRYQIYYILKAIIERYIFK